jgi:DNA-binding phage protein
VWRLKYRSASFRVEMIVRTLSHFVKGDTKMGQLMLRDYITSDIGYKELENLTQIPQKSLVRMFGKSGNPTTSNLFKVIRAISEHEGIELSVSAAAAE